MKNKDNTKLAEIKNPRDSCVLWKAFLTENNSSTGQFLISNFFVGTRLFWDLLGDACATKAPTLNCFTFGKSARRTIAQGFAKQITRQKALDIMKDAENAGLIHKAFHPGSRESSFETSICNCCKDCCDTFNLWRNGTLPMINSTFHLSVIDKKTCTGCGICIDFCPTDAITLESDGYAVRQENSCIGCGVCARFCPEKAISLQEGFRRVFVPPPQPARNP